MLAICSYVMLLRVLCYQFADASEKLPIVRVKWGKRFLENAGRVLSKGFYNRDGVFTARYGLGLCVLCGSENKQ
jgi:hypothetical protein